jgi:F0F1-type ATP synthase assembly protein I
MMQLKPRIESRLRVDSVLVGAGLLVALVSMLWNHPLSFMLFLFVGMPLCAAGAILYLLTIVRSAGAPSKT